MILKLTLTNGKRIQRKRPAMIYARNTMKRKKVIVEFFDKNPWNFPSEVAFAEVPFDIVKYFRGAYPVISTFAK